MTEQQRSKWLVLFVPVLLTLAFLLVYYVVVYFCIMARLRSVSSLARTMWLRERTGGGDTLRDLRRALGLGLDDLPEVRFESSDDATRRLRDVRESEIRERRHCCLTRGSFVSTTDTEVNCLQHCAVTDGVERKYFARHGAFSDGQHGGRSGTYCMPTAAAACNERTSIAIYDPVAAHRTCRPQTRAFAGVGGNMIVACNGKLLDRATGCVWQDHIDHTLTFVDVDERLPDDSYRFVCAPGMLDERGNALLVAPFDRFVLVKNQCVRSIPYADAEAVPDYTTGQCRCKTRRNDYVNVAASDGSAPQCLPPSTSFDETSFETRISQSPCLALWDAPDSRRLHLCGRNNNEKINSFVPSVSNVYAQVFSRVVPSALALAENKIASVGKEEQ